MMRSAITDAAETAAGLRAALLSGCIEQVEQQVPALTEAAHRLSTVQSRLPSSKISTATLADLARELRGLKTSLNASAHLLRNGAALEDAWARLLHAAESGYTASGETASTAAAPRLSVEG